MRKIGTVQLSRLAEFYGMCDNLYNPDIISFIDFMSNITGNPSLGVAASLGDFRRQFIENLAANRALQERFLSRFLGTGYDVDAHYFDVYVQERMGVLTHFENKDYMTVKGKIIDAETLLSIPGTVTINGNAVLTDNSGNYMVTHLLEDDYTLVASAEGYKEGDTVQHLAPLDASPYFVSKHINLVLLPETPEPPPLEDTIYFIVPSSPADIYAIRPQGDIELLSAVNVPNGEIPSRMRLSPNKQTIIFSLGQLGGDTDLWTVDVGSGVATRLFRSPSYHEISPDWSPSGNSIVYRRDGATEIIEGGIVTSGVDGSDITFLRGTENGFDPLWSPDGDLILFHRGTVTNPDIYVIDNSGVVSNLTNYPADDYAWDWSPDSQEIIFYSNRSGDYELYRMNRDGGDIERLTHRIGVDSMADWSDDGQSIVYVQKISSTQRDLFIISRDGVEIRRLTNSIGKKYSPQW